MNIYGPLVFRWCTKAGLSRQDAEDLGQEVFRAVAARIETFQRNQPGDTFGGWLRTITRHKVADHWRRRARQPPTVDAAELLENLGKVESKDSAGQGASQLSESRNIIFGQALELIRSEFRTTSWQAFWGTAVEGRPTADVAADLKMTTMAVRKAKSRVLRRLREEFEGLGEAGD